MKKNKIAVFLVAFFILLAAGFSFYYYKVSTEHKQPQLGFLGGPDHQVRDFSFTDQDNKVITKKDLEGKVWVVEYFYTTCKSICPIMNKNMAKVYQRFKNDNDVVILSHTVDPETDNVAALKAYAERKDINADSKHWIFLTGDKEKLYNQARYSYLVSAVDSSKPTNIEDDFIHTNYFVLVDKHGKIRAHKNKEGNITLYDGTDMKSVNQMMADVDYLRQEP